MTSLFFVSLFLQFLQEGQQERHRDAEGEAIGDGLAQLNAAQTPDAGQGEDGMKRYLTFGNQRKYRSLCKERVKCRYTIKYSADRGKCRDEGTAPAAVGSDAKVRVLSAKAGENGMPFGKFAKERSNCL